ncbi:MAG: response regulator [Verrucomicrobia bacterium]|nr:response regulator [Verrucomicrobiota bacterium]
MGSRILIVDDSRIVMSLHSYILENAGYTCEGAPNGYAALERLFTGRFDLVVTDVNMPRMDGYALIEKIREQPDLKSLPIIVISTEEEARDQQRGFEAGANVYIVKPAKPHELVTNVRMLLGEKADAPV